MDREHRNRLIKERFQDLVAECGGGPEAAGETRVGQQTLSDYGNPQKRNIFPPADVIADLEEAACNPLVTRTLARLTEHVLVDVGGVGDTGAALSPSQAYATVLNKFARLVAEYQPFLEHGTTPDPHSLTAKGLLATAGDLGAAAVAFRARLAELCSEQAGEGR